MKETTKGIGQKSIKWGTKYCFLFDSWFASKKAAESAIEMGAEFIGMFVSIRQIGRASNRDE